MSSTFWPFVLTHTKKLASVISSNVSIHLLTHLFHCSIDIEAPVCINGAMFLTEYRKRLGLAFGRDVLTSGRGPFTRLQQRNESCLMCICNCGNFLQSLLKFSAQYCQSICNLALHVGIERFCRHHNWFQARLAEPCSATM